MLRASFYKIFLKGLLICSAALSLSSCTQEYLILARNMDRAQLINLEEVLHESGLEARTQPVKQNPVDAVPETVNLRETDTNRPSTNIYITLKNIYAEEDFTINLTPDSNFIVLKSVLGGLKFLKDDLQKGIFYFHAGNGNGLIEFQTYNTDGRIDRSILYSVRVKQRPAAAGDTTNTNKKGMTNTGDQTNAGAPSPNLSQMILSSIQGLSPTEASRELLNMLDSQEISDNDKEYIRYQLVDIMIGQRNYTPVEEQIGMIRSAPMKTLYRARLMKAKGNQKEAVRGYISLLSGAEETKKKAIIELEDLLLDMGSAEKGLLDSLQSETAKFKTDRDFYGSSMVRIARIYPFLKDVYAAKEILEKIKDDRNFSENVRADANEAYDALKRDFLDYR